jgi:hypothetical protein
MVNLQRFLAFYLLLRLYMEITDLPFLFPAIKFAFMVVIMYVYGHENSNINFVIFYSDKLRNTQVTSPSLSFGNYIQRCRQFFPAFLLF